MWGGSGWHYAKIGLALPQDNWLWTRRETLHVARADGTVDCEGFERLVQLARRRPGEAPA